MNSSCPHRQPRPADLARLEQALVAARARCEAAGESWTESRQRTYALLVGAGEPVKAYDLIQRYGAGNRAAKPPTVYRSLDLLMSIGLVQKVVTMGAYLALPDGATTDSAGLLVCTCCHAVEPFPHGGLAAISGAPKDFFIERIVLEASGLCRHCR